MGGNIALQPESSASSRARRTASAYGIGLAGDDLLDRAIGDDDLGAHGVDQVAAGGDVDVGHEGEPVRREPRRQHRHLDDRHPVPAGDLGGDPEHLEVGQLLGTADLEHAAQCPGFVGHADQIPDHVVDGDRLRPGRDPSRHHHRRQVLDQLPGQLPGDSSAPHDDPRPQHRDRNAGRTEQALDLPPRAQVSGQLGALGSQPAEVDDLVHAGRRGRLPERPRCPCITVLEVIGIERVDQVVGDTDTPQRRIERRPGPARPPPTAVPGPSYSSGRRVIARTSCPAAIRAGTSRPPMKPVAPVTRISVTSGAVPRSVAPDTHSSGALGDVGAPGLVHAGLVGLHQRGDRQRLESLDDLLDLLRRDALLLVDRPDLRAEQLVQLLRDRAPVRGVDLGRRAGRLDRVAEVEQAEPDAELRTRDLEPTAAARSAGRPSASRVSRSAASERRPAWRSSSARAQLLARSRPSRARASRGAGRCPRERRPRGCRATYLSIADSVKPWPWSSCTSWSRATWSAL